jgi:SPX domain protein involved in polyphosphate accumulation
MITDAPYWLVDFLNSKVVAWYIPRIAANLGGKGVRYFKQYIEMLPVPLANCMTDIFKYYDFSEEEITLISSSVRP